MRSTRKAWHAVDQAPPEAPQVCEPVPENLVAPCRSAGAVLCRASLRSATCGAASARRAG